HIDALVSNLSPRLPGRVAVAALGAYGRRELTPHAEAELLFLHASDLSTQTVTETVCYPLWEKAVRVEPFVRTLVESDAETRRSWSAAARLLDVRLVAGDASLLDELTRKMQQWRKDREHLLHRIRAEVEHRHSTHPSPTSSRTPDPVAGRGGLLDIQALRW